MNTVSQDPLGLTGTGSSLALVSHVRVPLPPARLVEIRNSLAEGGNIVALLRETLVVIGSDNDGYTLRATPDSKERIYVTRGQLDEFADTLKRHRFDDMHFMATMATGIRRSA
jgi:hypothetical protein